MDRQPNDRTASDDIAYLESVVKQHGSIFRQVRQETDVGVTCFIELASDRAAGKLVAMQVSSGDSYLADGKQEFSVSVDQAQIDYWCAYAVPVVLVCYSASMRIAAWTPIGEYVAGEVYHNRTPVTSIRIPFSSEFNVKALSEGIAALADVHAKGRVLLKCVDKCLVGDAKQRLQGLSILAAHPDSRDSRTVAFVARRLLFDEDVSVADEAMRTLAYHVGRSRWSANPNSVEEKALIGYAVDLCRDFTATECRKLVDRIDDGCFSGPTSAAERVLDLLACCETSRSITDEIAADNDQPMRRRVNALYLSFDGDVGELLASWELAHDPNLGDVYRAIYPHDQGEGQ
jgi:hypothetical protein